MTEERDYSAYIAESPRTLSKEQMMRRIYWELIRQAIRTNSSVLPVVLAQVVLPEGSKWEERVEKLAKRLGVTDLARYIEDLKRRVECIDKVQYVLHGQNAQTENPLKYLIAELRKLPDCVFISFTDTASLASWLDAQTENLQEPDERLNVQSVIGSCWCDFRRVIGGNRSGYRYIVFGLMALSFFFFVRLIPHVLGLSAFSKRLSEAWYRQRSDHFEDPNWIRNVGLEMRPIVFWSLCFAPPAVLLMMLHHSIDRVFASFKRPPHQKPSNQLPNQGLALRQNVSKDAEGPAAFYLSPLFSLCLFVVVASGLPVFICFGIYRFLHVDALFGSPYPDYGLARSFFLEKLYIMSFAWCATCIFTRAYFTFPWCFMSSEYTVELDEYAIRKLPIKGWFSDMLLTSLPGTHSFRQLRWGQVSDAAIISSSQHTELEPSERNLFTRVMSSFSRLQEAMFDAAEISGETLELRSEAHGTIDVRLWELSGDDRSRLFVALKKLAPSLQLSRQVQEALVGSQTLNDPRYTEIWFDVLTREMQSKRNDLVAGDQLQQGRYTVAGKLDSGGQASIYLASEQDGNNVVLKEFHLAPDEDLGVSMDSAAAFENESTILAQLDHPSIVKMHNMFVDSGRVYLVLERVEGKSLRRLVGEEGPLDQLKALELALQMAELLKYLHGQSPCVIHRDFTPDNLMLQPNGQLKLIDFSIAERRKKSSPGDCAGKHCYTPPEQFRGEAECASDIYALGATLQFLLTGKDPEPLSQSSPANCGVNVDTEFSKLVEHATALEISDRCESADWLSVELTRLKDVLSSNAPPAQAPCLSEVDRLRAIEDIIAACDAAPVVPAAPESELATVLTGTVLEVPNTIKVPRKQKLKQKKKKARSNP